MPILFRPSQAYELKVQLNGIRPPIWRKIVVPSGITLDRLHDVIQIAMGWSDSHLHRFEIGRRGFTELCEGLDEGCGEDESRVRLHDVVTDSKAKFTYEYDLGDSWCHAITVVQVILVPVGHVVDIACTAGKRACPPEDTGGALGFAEFIEAMTDRRHPDHKSAVEWYGGRFDVEAFDRDAVNRALAMYARHARPRRLPATE